MSGLLSVGAGALTANQAALQTTGNNIANVNTPGFSRQTVVFQAVPGQFTGGGYIGKGVELATIQRNYSEFLTRQSALAGATRAGDTARADKLTQLEGIFPGGTNGLGAAISNLLNSFSDVAAVPTDLTARTVTLTQIDETAARLRATSQSLDDLQSGTSKEIAQKVEAINSLAVNIASINDKIARTHGSGQPPNDLLDQRDQMVRDLNQYIQTTSIPASDGTVGIFIGGSQALVLGSAAGALKLTSDDFNDPLKTKLTLERYGQSIPLDENTLGGGTVPSLMRFQNIDLAEGRNLLGRLTLSVSTSMNAQQKLGLDLDGNVGGNLFAVAGITNNVSSAANNTGTANMTLGISDLTKFAASDYEVDFSGTGPSTTGTIRRISDGVSTSFSTFPVTIDGLTISVAGSANGGDRFLLKPFSAAAGTIRAEFSSPRALAVASPVAGKMGAANTGSLQLGSLVARSNPPTNVPTTIRFTGPNTYIRSDEFPALDFNDPANFVSFTPHTYTSGQAIEYTQIPKYPTPAIPFSAVTTSAAGNPTFPVDNLTITNPAALTGETYTINVVSVGPDPVLGVPWGQAIYTITGSISGTSGPITAPPFNNVVPISIPISDPSMPGLSMNLTGDVRTGATVTIAPAVYAEPVFTNWSLTLQGSPKNGDTFKIFDIKDAANNSGVNYKLNAGNASAMMNLRDVAMFDGSALTDGYAGLMSRIGVRSQSANYAANVSSSIAGSLETQRTAVSGVNLDEEAARLIQYQQAYQASAKIIQVSQSIFTTLIQTMG